MTEISPDANELKKLEYYVPATHVDTTTQALFAAGAGKIGNYDCCCWLTEGTGQFRALSGSQPFLGQRGEIHREPEFKVELVFRADLKVQVIQALKESHPYEEPAYAILSVDY